jgi:hypothetical protein
MKMSDSCEFESLKIQSVTWGAFPWHWLCLTIALATGWRAFLLLWTGGGTESDEAIMGLIAQRISEGRDFPVWFYGQEYMGALEGYVAALLVGSFGPGPIIVKLTALFFAIMTVGTGYVLAVKWFGDSVHSRFTGLCWAISPIMFSVWSLKLRGVVSTMALGQMALLLACAYVSQPRYIWAFLCGLCVGLGMWLNLLFIPYAAAIFLYLISRRMLFRHISKTSAMAAGFLLGFLPFWYYNVTHQMATFKWVAGGRGGGLAEKWDLLIGRHIPVLLGFISPWGPEATSGILWFVCILVIVVLLTVFLYHSRQSLCRSLTVSRKPTTGVEMIWAVGICFIACSLYSRFGSEYESRYAVILYSLIIPAIGVFVGELWRLGDRRRIIAFVVAIGVVGSNVALTVSEKPAYLFEALHQARGRIQAPSRMTDVVRILDAERVTGVRAEYWIAIRIAFESDDRIAVVTGPNRIPGSTDRYVKAVRKALVFQVDDNSWESEVQSLSARGISSKVYTSSIYRVVILDDEGYHPDEWQVTAINSIGLSNIVDRNEFTCWTPQAVQADGQWCVVDMARVQLVGCIGFLFGAGDEPEDLKVDLSDDGQAWHEVYRGPVATTSWKCCFPERLSRFIRITQKGQSRFSRWWSISEVYVYPKSLLSGAGDDRFRYVVRSSCGHHPEWAADGDLNTRWTTGAEQSPGQWLDLDLKSIRHPSALKCSFGVGDEPLKLKISVSVDALVWRSVFEGEHVEREFKCELDRKPARFVRFVQDGGPHPLHQWWSVKEVEIIE